MSQTDYFNGGSGIKAHSNSHEIAFYDKVQDLKRAKISQNGLMKLIAKYSSDYLTQLLIKKPLKCYEWKCDLENGKNLNKC
jgi:hypothetical protein